MSKVSFLQIRSKLRRLTAKGLRVSFRGSKPSNLDVRLDGPADLIAEAKQLLR